MNNVQIGQKCLLQAKLLGRYADESFKFKHRTSIEENVSGLRESIISLSIKLVYGLHKPILFSSLSLLT